MTVQLPGTEEDGSRKRKAHNKSRRGCRNCKLRRVKCDETKPKCNKCTTFGVTCNYDPKAADLQMSFDGVVSMKIPPKSTAIISQPPRPITKMPDFLYPPIISDNLSSYHMDRQSLERLDRFHRRTVLSLGTARTAPLFQAEVFKLAYSAPYLMHVVQAITAIHDRYLSPTADPHYSPTEIYHWSKAASLFSQKLSAPVRLEDRDALWATAVLFGSTAFSWVEASTPEEAWPLKPSDLSDLEWLRMSEGKMSVWELTDPLRPDSVFHVLASENKKDHSFAHTSNPVVTGLEGFPAGFIQLYGLDESSTEENNPYHAAVHALAPLLHIECNQSTIAIFLMVIPYMGPRFKNLLGMKDPRALLLLAYWYAKVCDSVWWISRRALLECQAICLYLERYYADEVTIQELLEFPRMRCQTLTQAAR